MNKITQAKLIPTINDFHKDGDHYEGCLDRKGIIDFTVYKTDIGDGPVWFATCRSWYTGNITRSALNKNRKRAIAKAAIELWNTKDPALMRQCIWDL